MRNFKEAQSLRLEQRFCLALEDEEIDAIRTSNLERHARILGVPLPRRWNDNGTETDYWYVGTQTGHVSLTREGTKLLKAELRTEEAARGTAFWERLKPFGALVAGAAAVITAIAKLLSK